MTSADPFVSECVAVLSRTPATLGASLRGLPDVWVHATDGADTWSPYDCVGHLIHGEKTDWMQRASTILTRGEAVPFTPFDRLAQFRDSRGKSLAALLDLFADLRRENLRALDLLQISARQLELTGTHPDFGKVTLRQLLSTWVVHDLNHLNQINRTMARRYESEVGPWTAYLSILKPRTR